MLLQACYSACADRKHYQPEEALMGITYFKKYKHIFVNYIYM